MESAVTQLPSTVLVIIVVVLFLRFMERQVGFIRVLHDEHIAAREQSRLAIKDFTDVVRELSVTIDRLELKINNGRK